MRPASTSHGVVPGLRRRGVPGGEDAALPGAGQGDLLAAYLPVSPVGRDSDPHFPLCYGLVFGVP